MTLAVNIAQGGSNNVTFRNKLINGNMVIDQRNAGASVAVSNGTNTFITDRWSVFENTTAAFSWQQVADAPSGFYNSLKGTITTANSSPTASDLVQCKTTIEGYNIADLNWGATAASAGQTAKPVTLSFWVKSTLTGTFGGSLGNASLARTYPFTYTISSANTWTQASVTIAGDTSGTWSTDNSLGMYVFFDLGCGSSYIGTANAWASADYRGATGDTKVANTLNATWQITGVQLEAGTTASPFEYRQYGTELQLCMRYFQLMGSGGACGTAESGTRASMTYLFPVPMRASATGTLNASNGTLNQPQGGPNTITTTNNFFFAGVGGTYTTGGWLVFDNPSSIWTTGRVIISNGSQGMVQFSAEL